MIANNELRINKALLLFELKLIFLSNSDLYFMPKSKIFDYIHQYKFLLLITSVTLEDLFLTEIAYF